MPADKVTSDTPWHIVFVLDNSGSMKESGDATQLREAMIATINEFQHRNSGGKDYFYVSAIAFDLEAKILFEHKKPSFIQNDVFDIFGTSEYMTDMSLALKTAGDILERNGGKETDFRPYVYLLSDGQANENTDSILVEAERIKTMDIPAGSPKIVSIGLGTDVEPSFLKKISSAESFVPILNAENLSYLFPKIGTLSGSGEGEEELDRLADEFNESDSVEEWDTLKD